MLIGTINCGENFPLFQANSRRWSVASTKIFGPYWHKSSRKEMVLAIPTDNCNLVSGSTPMIQPGRRSLSMTFRLSYVSANETQSSNPVGAYRYVNSRKFISLCRWSMAPPKTAVAQPLPNPWLRACTSCLQIIRASVVYKLLTLCLFYLTLRCSLFFSVCSNLPIYA
jgi:hypothetical protein